MPKGMQAIYTRTLTTSGVTQVNFANIPQTFTDLKVLASVRDGRTDAQFANVAVRFNGSGSSIYSNMNIAATANTGYSDSFGTQDAFYYNFYAAGAIAATNSFSNVDMYIPNYISSGFKQCIIDNAVDVNSSTEGLLVLNAGLYRSNAPITSITFFAQNVAFAQNTTFTLYGIGR